MPEKVDTISWIEIQRYLKQALNEVLNGFKVDYEVQLHAAQDCVKVLANKLDIISDECMLSAEDALLLIRISYLCEEEFGNEEFSTRMGFAMAEGRQIAARLEKITLGFVPKTMRATAS